MNHCSKNIPTVNQKLERLRKELEELFVMKQSGTANDLELTGEVEANADAIASLVRLLGVGNKSELTTDNKESLVEAVNEINSRIDDFELIEVNNLGGEPQFKAVKIITNKG